MATSPAEDVQLTYRWFETTTGSTNDISAVTDAQQSDSLKLDTSLVGTRNYVCQVSTSDDGIAYSSIVPVTVTEKTPDLPTENPDDTESDNSQPTESTEQKQPTDETKPAGNEQDKPQKDNGAPWWSLVGLAAAGAGVGVAVLLVKKKA